MNNSVALLGFYGGDIEHACSGWSSTSRELTPAKLARMGKFLKMLAENGHHTPFEKSMLHFLVTCDTASHIHFLKHRIGVSVNAESARYKEFIEEKFVVPDDWPLEARTALANHMETSFAYYHHYIKLLEEAGLSRKRAKESARFFLPYATQVTLDVSFNFRSFMHFQGLRNQSDAQREIREIAAEMLRLVKETGKFPLSLEGFGYA